MPTEVLFKAREGDPTFEESVARRAETAGGGDAALAAIFGKAQAAVLVGDGKQAGADPARLAATYEWTPWEAFRLVALWAMHETKAKMERLCDEFLALEPYGDYLRAEKDLKANLEQPLLRLPEVVAVTDLVAPGPQTARFLAEVDRLCFPELLKALSTAAFDELEAHFRELLPGIRTFVHEDHHEEATDEARPPKRAPLGDRADSTPRAWRRALLGGSSRELWTKRSLSSVGADEPGGAPAGPDCAHFFDAPGAAGAPPQSDVGADGVRLVFDTKPPGKLLADDDIKPPGKLLADDDAASSGAVDDFVDAGTWPTRCLLKCAPEVSIKKTTRMGAKIDEYERDKGGGLYPYCAFIGDSLRASIVCEDAEAFWKTYEALRGDPDDPAQRFRVLRLKNKLGVGKEPFNFHLNCSFHPSTFRAPIQLEIQIWAAAIMDLNDVSHWQYEVARAGSVGAF